MIEGAHRGHPSRIFYNGTLKEDNEARATIDTIGEKDATHIRKLNCKNFLEDLGPIIPEMLIEISARREIGHVVFEDGTEIDIHENSDMYFIHGNFKEAAVNGLPGVIKRYALINSQTRNQLVFDVYAPLDEDPREWTVKSIKEFLNGTFKNESFLVA